VVVPAPLANRGIHHSIIKASGAIPNRETGKAFAVSARNDDNPRKKVQIAVRLSRAISKEVTGCGQNPQPFSFVLPTPRQASG
jgi:hypothetical protein